MTSQFTSVKKQKKKSRHPGQTGSFPVTGVTRLDLHYIGVELIHSHLYGTDQNGVGWGGGSFMNLNIVTSESGLIHKCIIIVIIIIIEKKNWT